MVVDKDAIQEELSIGGRWLGAAHEWMQWNLPNGGNVMWGSHEMCHLTVHDLEEFAQTVAVAAVVNERMKL